MTPLRLPFLFLALACAALPLSAQEKARRVLFLGNSITKHGPKADIDWSGNWGMAASAEDRDYVHLVTKALQARPGPKAEILVRNIADFERAHDGYDLASKLKDAVTFEADLIILAIGENVPALKSPEDKARFQADAARLLNTVKGERRPTIIVRSCFWADTAKDEALRQACASVGGTYVDISALSKDEHNYARSERPYKNTGVAHHPGDQGMAAIADAILRAIR